VASITIEVQGAPRYEGIIIAATVDGRSLGAHKTRKHQFVFEQGQRMLLFVNVPFAGQKARHRPARSADYGSRLVCTIVSSWALPPSSKAVDSKRPYSRI
jgi:hypothetical protein